MNNIDLATVDIDALVADRATFNQFFYTPLQTALAELERRNNDPEINAYLATMPAGIPQELEGKKSAIVFRPIATPDYDFRRFISIAHMIPQLRPVVMEYHEDRYLNRNDCKFALGKLCFNTGKSKTGEMLFENKKIIDINDANKKRISEVKTHWGERLIDFHHDFLKHSFLQKTNTELDLVDVSEWLKLSGGAPELYYIPVLSIFLKHGILFENFMLNKTELEYTKNIILPAFITVYERSGFKPLIVPLQPTEIEGEKFWLSHPQDAMEYVNQKLV